MWFDVGWWDSNGQFHMNKIDYGNGGFAAPDESWDYIAKNFQSGATGNPYGTVDDDGNMSKYDLAQIMLSYGAGYSDLFDPDSKQSATELMTEKLKEIASQYQLDISTEDGLEQAKSILDSMAYDANKRSIESSRQDLIQQTRDEWTSSQKAKREYTNPYFIARELGLDPVKDWDKIREISEQRERGE